MDATIGAERRRWGVGAAGGVGWAARAWRQRCVKSATKSAMGFHHQFLNPNNSYNELSKADSLLLFLHRARSQGIGLHTFEQWDDMD